MEIVRNGQKILLTEWELFQAYEEQKYLYLKESVLENMEDCLPKEMYSKLKEMKITRKEASLYSKNIMRIIIWNMMWH